MIAPQIDINAGSPGRRPDNREIGRCLKRQDSGSAHPILYSRTFTDNFHQFQKILLQRMNQTGGLPDQIARHIESYAAGNHHATQETVPCQFFAEPHHQFLLPRSLARPYRKTDSRANITDIADVVVQPFQFRRQHSQIQRPFRNHCRPHRFHRLREGQGMGNAASAASPFHPKNCLLRRKTFQ